MAVATNPILPGCYPDPSICRVGPDYYIVNSTFEWFPGVPIHHSTDLIHWRLIGHALTQTRLADLRGVRDSAGIWAPSLSHDGERFHLIYSVVRTFGGAYKDVHNYLITADNIAGPWSDPVYLNASGFDPSLFHDTDGRKWLVNMCWDHRKDHPSFGGILLQEYDPTLQRLVGPVRNIYQREHLIEGPNLYRRDGWYYLMLAEGGTGWNHGVSMARSRSVAGPYEPDPQPAVMTTRDDPGWPLQKAGHGELVQTPGGEWYMAHLCSRPVGPSRRCVLGRETAIQRCVWSGDGWLRLAHGSVLPALQVEIPSQASADAAEPSAGFHADFGKPVLSPQWSALRRPIEPSWASLTDRPGWLRLRGGESLHSLFDQSLLAVRLTTTGCVVSTSIAFNPTNFQQMAGLVCWYDTRTHYYLRLTHTPGVGATVGVVSTDDGVYDEPAGGEVPVEGWPACHLRAVFAGAELTFHVSPDGGQWTRVGPVFDATRLSDDYGTGLHFTGTFVGLAAQDLSGAGAVADFGGFEVHHTTGPSHVSGSSCGDAGPLHATVSNGKAAT